jgi:hypothetical protein
VQIINGVVDDAAKAGNEVLYNRAKRMGLLHAPAVVSLWLSAVRPVLEYGAALWGPFLGENEIKRLESVQHTFGRELLGVGLVENVFVRDELSLQLLSARRKQLALMFWQSLCAADRDTLHSRIFHERCRQADRGQAANSWCTAVRSLMSGYGFKSEWQAREAPSDWRRRVKDAVANSDRSQLQSELMGSTLMRFRLGHFRSWRVRWRPAAYLGNVVDHTGVRLVCQLRAGTLQLNDYLGHVMRWPEESSMRHCASCGTGAAETVPHLVATCPAAAALRRAFRESVREKLPTVGAFKTEDDSAWFGWLLGDSAWLGRSAARVFDSAARVFVKKLWALRQSRGGVFTVRRSGSSGRLVVAKEWQFLAPVFVRSRL